MQRESTGSGQGCRLLLVEDELDLAELVEQALQTEGHGVTHAGSVSEAMSLLKAGTFDAAILDVELRDGVVFPVADRLAVLGIPYLFASAVYDQLVPVRHRHAAFVAKPFHIDALQRAVRQAVNEPSPPDGHHGDHRRAG